MHNSLFAPAPRRNGRIILTLTASLLFHGSLIGLAAFWPVRPVPTDPGVTIVDDQPPGFSENKQELPPETTPDEHDPIQPDLKVSDPVDAPPPTIETDDNDMLLSTPVPPSKPRTTTRTASPTTTARTSHVSGSVSATGSPSSATGSGAAAGIRWNKPKPAYPAALRLAHVQGSGIVRVTTDASGQVVNALIVKSTGNALLDDNTCRSARSFWSGPPDSTLSVPITYQIQ